MVSTVASTSRLTMSSSISSTRGSSRCAWKSSMHLVCHFAAGIRRKLLGENHLKCLRCQFPARTHRGRSIHLVAHGHFMQPAWGFEQLSGTRSVGGAYEAVALH